MAKHNHTNNKQNSELSYSSKEKSCEVARSARYFRGWTDKPLKQILALHYVTDNSAHTHA